MLNLKEIPISISQETDRYDHSFLRGLLPELKTGTSFDDKKSQRVISNPNEIKDFLKEFAAIHNRAMMYHHWQNSWHVCNYLYENLRFLPWSNCMAGNAYHVTGNDGTRTNGELTHFLSLNEYKRNNILPLYLTTGVRLKGALISQEYKYGKGEHGLNMLIGDEHNLWFKKMPEISELNPTISSYSWIKEKSLSV